MKAGIPITQGESMKKILIALMAVVAAASVWAADTMITGVNSETGIGTFKVVSDGTNCTLTVDKLVVSDSSSLPGGYVSNVVAQTASIAGSVTLTKATNTIYYLDASTNVATNTIIYVTGVAVTTAGVTTNVSVTYK